MSYNPAAAARGSAGLGQEAHDQGTMQIQALSLSGEALDGESDTSSARLSPLLRQEEVQERSTPRSLLGQESQPSSLGPGPSLMVDDAVATSELQAGVKAAAPAPTDSATPIHVRAGLLNETIERWKGKDRAEPLISAAVIPTQPRPTSHIAIPPPQETGEAARDPQPSAEISPPGAANELTDFPPLPQLQESKPATNGTTGNAGKAMFASSAVSSVHRRRVMATTNALTKYETELTDQDRAKQKDAVRRYLAERVRTDWEWQWPRPDGRPISRPGSPLTDNGELAGNVSEAFEEQWKERDEWLSNTSEGEGPEPAAAEYAARQDASAREDPFCFGSPETVGSAIRKHEMGRKRRRKKRLAEEMAYNDGMRCFVQRRDAWTGARQAAPSSSSDNNGLTRPRTKRSSLYSLLPGKSTVTADGEPESDNALSRTRTKRSSIYSILPGRGSTPTATDTTEPETESEWDIAIEIPIAAPILPPENAMRASITPAAYNTIYEKVILQQLTPSCPMNLKDVTRSCVQGWKRDGEWPPKSTEPAKKKSRRLSFVSLFSTEKNDDKDRERERDVERAREKADNNHAEGHHEKTLKRPAATIGKSIRKIMFWKEKHDCHGTAEGGQDGNGHGHGRSRTNSPAPPET